MNGNIQDNPFVVQQPNLGAMGQNIANIVLQKRAEKAAAEKEVAWQDAFNTFKGDRSPTNMMNLYQVAPERFAQFSEGFKAMNELERTQNVQNNAEVMSLIQSGGSEDAAGKAATLSRAYREGGQFKDAEKWDDIANAIASGKGEDAYDMLMMINSATPEGQAANEAVHGMREERRAAAAGEADLLKIANDLEFATPEDKARAMEVADGHNMETAQALIELASVRGAAGKDGMTSDQFYKAEQALRKEYDSYAEPYNQVLDSAYQVNEMAKQGTGFGDQAMIMLFNKVLDPDSVVRESEAKMTAENQSLVNRGRTLLASLEAGERLSPEARQELLDSVNAMQTLADTQITSERDRLMNTVEYFGFGEDRIFHMENPRGEAQTGEASNAPGTTAPIVNTGVKGMSLSQLQEALIKANPNWTEQQKADVRKMNERQLQEAAPNGYNYFMKQYGAADEGTAGATEVNW